MNLLTQAIKKTGKRLCRISPLPMMLQERILFACQLGYWPNFNEPRSFSEKLHVRKLNDQNQRLVRLSDKLSVRDHVAAIAGKEYLVPLRYVGDQINPSILLSLGNDIVLKRNDDSGSSVVIEQNSLEISKKACRAVIQKAGYGQRTNEWWYRAIPAKFLVEERLSDAAQPDHLVEYRFFVFGSASGSPKAYIEVIRRNASHQPECSFFDLNGNPLSFDGEHVSYVGCRPIAGGFPAIDAIPELLSVAQKLSQGHSFIRVDLHYVSGKVFFGELTFNPAEGRFRVSPPAFDFEMGNQWELPILQGDRDAA